MERNNLNTPVLAAGILMAVTFLVHVFVGGPELYGPIRQSSLSMIERSTWSVVWHFTSLQLLMLSVALFYLARHRNKGVFVYVLVTSIGFAALFIAYGFFDLGSVWPMPQWIAFANVTVLMIWGRDRP